MRQVRSCRMSQPHDCFDTLGNYIVSSNPIMLRLCCLTAFSISLLSAQYTGSSACKTCHPSLYQRWSRTRMANVIRDPREHPDAIIPDLSKPNPIYPFTKDDVAFVYGSKWKQRYFKKIGDDYFTLPVQ